MHYPRRLIPRTELTKFDDGPQLDRIGVATRAQDQLVRLEIRDGWRVPGIFPFDPNRPSSRQGRSARWFRELDVAERRTTEDEGGEQEQGPGQQHDELVIGGIKLSSSDGDDEIDAPLATGIVGRIGET